MDVEILCHFLNQLLRQYSIPIVLHWSLNVKKIKLRRQNFNVLFEEMLSSQVEAGVP